MSLGFETECSNALDCLQVVFLGQKCDYETGMGTNNQAANLKKKLRKNTLDCGSLMSSSFV